MLMTPQSHQTPPATGNSLRLEAGGSKVEILFKKKKQNPWQDKETDQQLKPPILSLRIRTTQGKTTFHLYNTHTRRKDFESLYHKQKINMQGAIPWLNIMKNTLVQKHHIHMYKFYVSAHHTHTSQIFTGQYIISSQWQLERQVTVSVTDAKFLSFPGSYAPPSPQFGGKDLGR